MDNPDLVRKKPQQGTLHPHCGSICTDLIDFFNSDTKKYCQFYSAGCFIFITEKSFYKAEQISSPDQMFQDQWNGSAPDIPSAGQCLFVTFPYCCHIPFRERSLSTDRAVDSTVSPPYTSKGMASIKK